MQEVINEALIPMINEGLISVSRIHELIYIKEFVDRVSTRKYIDSESEENLRERFGVSPSIITWGDYFQTEMATALVHLSEEEFTRALDTVRYDIISSFQIFEDKKIDFIEWIDMAYVSVTGGQDYACEEDPQDILHLKILKDYYINMGIVNRFTKAELHWHDSFIRAEAM